MEFYKLYPSLKKDISPCFQCEKKPDLLCDCWLRQQWLKRMDEESNEVTE